jgi:hypothetical protein
LKKIDESPPQGEDNSQSHSLPNFEKDLFKTECKISDLPTRISIVDRGSKSFILGNKKCLTVNAEIEIPGRSPMMGSYKGDKTEVLTKSVCFCCRPVYGLVATNQGSFRASNGGLTVSYDGQLFEGYFDHITTNIMACYVAEGNVKYEGCFKQGLRCGKGVQWIFEKEVGNFVKVFDGVWRDGAPWKGTKYYNDGTEKQVLNGKEND